MRARPLRQSSAPTVPALGLRRPRDATGRPAGPRSPTRSARFGYSPRPCRSAGQADLMDSRAEAVALAHPAGQVGRRLDRKAPDEGPEQPLGVISEDGGAVAQTRRLRLDQTQHGLDHHRGVDRRAAALQHVEPGLDVRGIGVGDEEAAGAKRPRGRKSSYPDASGDLHVNFRPLVAFGLQTLCTGGAKGRCGHRTGDVPHTGPDSPGRRRRTRVKVLASGRKRLYSRPP